MKKTTLFLFLLISTFSFAQQFEWADQFGGTDYEAVNKLAKDGAGNIYTVGTFNSSGDFDPSAGTSILTSAGAQDIFLVKLKTDGSFSWAKRFGGSFQDFGDAIATTETAKIYIAGKFRGTADFDPSLVNFPLISNGQDDAYICKMDSAGNFVWAVQAGGTGVDYIESVTTDTAENVYAIGYFSGTVDFDPSGGSYPLTSSGGGDMFLWKLDALGNLIWAKRIGGTSGEIGQDLALDSSGNIYATGSFYGTVDFDPGLSTTNLSASGFNDDIFILKLDTAGVFSWAKKMGGSGNDVGNAIAIDADGNPCVAGNFNAVGDFDPNAATFTLTPNGTNGDIFVVKLTAAGTLAWAKNASGPMLEQPYDLAIHPTGDIYITGLFDGTVDFDPSANSFPLTSAGVGDIFILQLTDSGTFVWAGRIGDAQNDQGTGIMALNGRLVISGGFTQLADFDPGVGTFNINSFGNTMDGFVVKLCASYQVTIPTTICIGDSLFAAGSWQYNAGTYTDSYLSVYGCDSIITTILSIDSPVVNLGIDTSICEGENVLLDAGNLGSTYLWNTNETTQTISIDSVGIYFVELIDSSNTFSPSQIAVSINPLPMVTFAPLSPDTFCNFNQLYPITGGSPLGGIYSGSGISSGQFNPAIAGVGTHTIIYSYSDSNACSASNSQTAYVDLCTGITNEIIKNEILLFPNPTTGIVNIMLWGGNSTIQLTVTNLLGEIKIRTEIPENLNQSSYTLNLSQLPSGVYFIELFDKNQSSKLKVIKK